MWLLERHSAKGGLISWGIVTMAGMPSPMIDAISNDPYACLLRSECEHLLWFYPKDRPRPKTKTQGLKLLALATVGAGNGRLVPANTAAFFAYDAYSELT
jgi:hypothetical protein